MVPAPLTPDSPKQRAAQILQATLDKLGVKLEIQQTDGGGYEKSLFGGTLPFDMQLWWGYRADPDQYLSNLLNSGGKYARAYGYANPAIDQLFVEQRAAQTLDERRKKWRQMIDLMNDDATLIPWHYGSDFKGVQKTVKGFVHRQDALTLFQDIWLAA